MLNSPIGMKVLMPYVNSLMESRLTILVDSGRVELFFMIIDCDCTQCISVKVNN